MHQGQVLISLLGAPQKTKLTTVTQRQSAWVGPMLAPKLSFQSPWAPTSLGHCVCGFPHPGLEPHPPPNSYTPSYTGLSSIGLPEFNSVLCCRSQAIIILRFNLYRLTLLRDTISQQTPLILWLFPDFYNVPWTLGVGVFHRCIYWDWATQLCFDWLWILQQLRHFF